MGILTPSKLMLLSTSISIITSIDPISATFRKFCVNLWWNHPIRSTQFHFPSYETQTNLPWPFYHFHYHCCLVNHQWRCIYQPDLKIRKWYQNHFFGTRMLLWLKRRMMYLMYSLFMCWSSSHVQPPVMMETVYLPLFVWLWFLNELVIIKGVCYYCNQLIP